MVGRLTLWIATFTPEITYKRPWDTLLQLRKSIQWIRSRSTELPENAEKQVH